MNLHLTRGLQATRLEYPNSIYQNCAEGLEFLQTPSEQRGDVTSKGKVCHVQASNVAFERLKSDICWRKCFKLQNSQMIYTLETGQVTPIISQWALPGEHQLKASGQAGGDMQGPLHSTGTLYFWVSMHREAVEQLPAPTEDSSSEDRVEEATRGRMRYMQISYQYKPSPLPPMATTRNAAVLLWKDSLHHH